MTTPNTIMPRTKTPDLTVPVTGGGDFDLVRDAGENGTLISFFRGRHCPVCINQLKELDALIPEFNKRGYNVVAISSDTEERSAEMHDLVAPTNLKLGYGLDLTKAREFGLFISTSRGETSIGIVEPDLFSEPGLFIIDPDKTLFFSSINSMPFARANFKELIGSLDFRKKVNYPPRGEYTGEV